MIGTSIGAINAAIIVGNAPEARLARLREFWSRMASHATGKLWGTAPPWGAPAANLEVLTAGIDGFFVPNPQALWGVHANLGTHHAAFYSTAPLAQPWASWWISRRSTHRRRA